MLRFTIRDLLWLMMVVGLSIGWWLQTVKQRTTVIDNWHTLDEINASGVWVDYYDNSRVLQIRIDKRGNLRIAPVTTMN